MELHHCGAEILDQVIKRFIRRIVTVEFLKGNRCLIFSDYSVFSAGAEVVWR